MVAFKKAGFKIYSLHGPMERVEMWLVTCADLILILVLDPWFQAILGEIAVVECSVQINLGVVSLCDQLLLGIDVS